MRPDSTSCPCFTCPYLDWSHPFIFMMTGVSSFSVLYLQPRSKLQPQTAAQLRSRRTQQTLQSQLPFFHLVTTLYTSRADHNRRQTLSIYVEKRSSKRNGRLIVVRLAFLFVLSIVQFSLFSIRFVVWTLNCQLFRNFPYKNWMQRLMKNWANLSKKREDGRSVKLRLLFYEFIIRSLRFIYIFAFSIFSNFKKKFLSELLVKDLNGETNPQMAAAAAEENI